MGVSGGAAGSVGVGAAVGVGVGAAVGVGVGATEVVGGASGRAHAMIRTNPQQRRAQRLDVRTA